MFKKIWLYNKGLALEKEGKLEEACKEYGKGAHLNDPKAMVAIARLYISGKFRPVTKSNLGDVLLGGGPIFPWSVQNWEEPDYESGIEWLKKAADLDDPKALSILGNMMSSGVGVKADIEKGLEYLDKAAKKGDISAKNDICLYRPDGKSLSDEEYEKCLSEFVNAADSDDTGAFPLYATLKSGTDKQQARFGYEIMAARNAGRGWDERFKASYLPSGIPLLPVAAKRGAWQTFVRIDLNGFKDKYPLIAVSSDILDPDQPQYLLESLHKGKIVGKAKYTSPDFGWLKREKEAVVIRLGTENTLSEQELEKVKNDFYLISDEYEPENVAFFVETGEKEYSLEIAGIADNKVDVLWRYTIGGSDRVDHYFEPKLTELTIYE